MAERIMTRSMSAKAAAGTSLTQPYLNSGFTEYSPRVDLAFNELLIRPDITDQTNTVRTRMRRWTQAVDAQVQVFGARFPHVANYSVFLPDNDAVSELKILMKQEEIEEGEGGYTPAQIYAWLKRRYLRVEDMNALEIEIAIKELDLPKCDSGMTLDDCVQALGLGYAKAQVDRVVGAILTKEASFPKVSDRKFTKMLSARLIQCAPEYIQVQYQMYVDISDAKDDLALPSAFTGWVKAMEDKLQAAHFLWQQQPKSIVTSIRLVR